MASLTVLMAQMRVGNVWSTAAPLHQLRSVTTAVSPPHMDRSVRYTCVPGCFSVLKPCHVCHVPEVVAAFITSLLSLRRHSLFFPEMLLCCRLQTVHHDELRGHRRVHFGTSCHMQTHLSEHPWILQLSLPPWLLPGARQQELQDERCCWSGHNLLALNELFSNTVMQFQHRERYPHSSRSSQMSWGIFHNLGLSVQKASKVSKHAKLITSSLCDE